MVAHRSAGARLRGLGYQVFYRLPARLRRRLVRLAVPTYTVGAVVLVRDPDDRLLLLRQPPGLGWTLPGGMIDKGERPIDCAVRELREETGLRVEATRFTAATPNAIPHTRGRWVDFVYQVGVDPREHDLEVDGAEVLEARWCELTGLPPLTVPTARLLAQFGIGPYRAPAQ